MDKMIQYVISIIIGVYLGKYLSGKCLNEPCLIDI